jgi:23S rRNA (uracil1939-C5)-methyltransferase
MFKVRTPMEVGSEIIVDIEKPAVGGPMLARHDGQVVLVWGGIPGERVRARVERAAKNTLHAETTEVLVASPDRRDAGPDWRCGGNTFAHIAYERQCRLKAEIICDALGRIGRMSSPPPPEVLGSPERGYRMRARLRVQNGRLGFFREGSHQLCDAAVSGQLLPETTDWIAAAERLVTRGRLAGLNGVELSENIRGDERACHLDLDAGVDASRFAALAGGLTGLSTARSDRPGVELLAGMPTVSDVLHVNPDDPRSALRLRRDVRAFFQANRYLVEPLLRRVVALAVPGRVIDLYAGVGLFGLSLAVSGADEVTLVEGDLVSGASLAENAAPFRDRVSIVRSSVESFLSAGRRHASTVIVDPPRTGMSKAALAGVLRAAPRRMVYVSCDVATFARDTRTILELGYALDSLTGMDLFPNTAHVEVIAAFSHR